MFIQGSTIQQGKWSSVPCDKTHDYWIPNVEEKESCGKLCTVHHFRKAQNKHIKHCVIRELL